MNSIIVTAKLYKNWGFSVVPIGENKKSTIPWREFQYTLMSDQMLEEVFNNPAVTGIGIICGEISGNLEGIDLDSKNDNSNLLSETFFAKLCTADKSLLYRLVIAKTRNKGYHFLYRYDKSERSEILARRPCTEAEKALNPHQKVKVLIERRGEGGYLVVQPTQGYKFIHNNLSSINFLHPTERDLLLKISRSFNLYQEEKSHYRSPLPRTKTLDSPFDDFDINGDAVTILEKHGWKVVRITETRTYLRRPGDTDHDTSGDFHHVLGLFGVFTTSTEFIPGKGYSPSAVYAILECQGDFTLAAKQLLKMGYGIPYAARAL